MTSGDGAFVRAVKGQDLCFYTHSPTAPQHPAGSRAFAHHSTQGIRLQPGEPVQNKSMTAPVRPVHSPKAVHAAALPGGWCSRDVQDAAGLSPRSLMLLQAWPHACSVISRSACSRLTVCVQQWPAWAIRRSAARRCAKKKKTPPKPPTDACGPSIQREAAMTSLGELASEETALSRRSWWKIPRARHCSGRHRGRSLRRNRGARRVGIHERNHQGTPARPLDETVRRVSRGTRRIAAGLQSVTRRMARATRSDRP